MKNHYKISLSNLSWGSLPVYLTKPKTPFAAKRFFILLAVVFFSLTSFAQVNLEDGLVAYYPFNGNANDESGTGNDGTVIGAVLAEDRFGNENSAYFFGGNDSRINTGNGIKPSFPFTYSAWIKPDSSISESSFIIYRNDKKSGYYYGFTIYYSWDGNVSGQIGNGGIAAPYSRYSKETTTSPIIENEWNHVLVIFDSNKIIRFYVDGVEQDSEYGSGTASTMAISNADGHIACALNNEGLWGFDFVGSIDDMRVYNRILTAEEINALYNEGGTTITANFSANPTTGEAPLVVDFTDLSTENATSWHWDFDNDGNIDSEEQNPSWTYTQPGSYTVSLAVSDGTYTNTKTKENYIEVNDLNYGLVAYYPFNGNANDESGNGNDGTVYGAALTVDRFGNAGNAYDFDGVDDFINCGNSSALNWQDSDYTVSVWVKRSSSGVQSSTHQVFIGKQLDDNPYRGWFFRFETNNIVRFSSIYDAYPWIGNGTVESTNQFINTDWDNYIGVLNGQDQLIKLYVNGQLNNSSSGSNTYNIDNASDLFIGRKLNGEYFPGKIDDIRIYNRALTEAEIQQLYNEGGYNHYITVEVSDEVSGIALENAVVYAQDFTNYYYGVPGSNPGEFKIFAPIGWGYQLTASAPQYAPETVHGVNITLNQNPLGSISLAPLDGVYYISELVPNPNPEISEVSVNGIFHRYYAIEDHEGKPASGVEVTLEFGEGESKTFISDKGTVDIFFSYNSVGDGEPHTEADFSIVSLNDNLLPEPIVFTGKVIYEVYSKSWDSYTTSKLGISNVEISEGVSSHSSLIEKNSSLPNPDDFEISRQVKAGIGVSSSVGAGLRIQCGELTMGEEFNAGVGIAGFVLTEEKYVFPHVEYNEYQAIAQYILFAYGHLHRLDAPLLNILKVSENVFNGQNTLVLRHKSNKFS